MGWIKNKARHIIEIISYLTQYIAFIYFHLSYFRHFWQKLGFFFWGIENTSSAFWDLLTFKGKSNLQKTVIMLLNWITVNISQYTLLLNTTKLHGNIFVNYIMSVLVGDLPGTFALLITMKYFGRRFNLFYAQTIIGVCCVLLAFLPKSVSLKTETLY